MSTTTHIKFAMQCAFVYIDVQRYCNNYYKVIIYFFQLTSYAKACDTNEILLPIQITSFWVRSNICLIYFYMH